MTESDEPQVTRSADLPVTEVFAQELHQAFEWDAPAPGRSTDAAETNIAACKVLAEILRDLGKTLWIAGWLIGPDRPAGVSPFGFGSDGVVGLATVAQIGGELGAGAVALLSDGNRYAAAALLRQLVEVEYLAWAFAEDHETAKAWLHADREARRKFWSPAQVRKRSGDRFLAADYWRHCDLGGHPTRDSAMLLPEHTRAIEIPALAAEVSSHLNHALTGVMRATPSLVPGGVPDSWLPAVDRLTEDIEAVRATLIDFGMNVNLSRFLGLVGRAERLQAEQGDTRAAAAATALSDYTPFTSVSNWEVQPQTISRETFMEIARRYRERKQGQPPDEG